MSIEDQIDDALDDWYTSQSWRDAMTWRAPWDEPVVRDPVTVVEVLMATGLDGYAAVAYMHWDYRRQLREAVRRFSEFARAYQRLLIQAAAAAQETTNAMLELLEPLMRLREVQPIRFPGRMSSVQLPPLQLPPLPMDSRPRWQSPYGPPQRGRR